MGRRKSLIRFSVWQIALKQRYRYRDSILQLPSRDAQRPQDDPRRSRRRAQHGEHVPLCARIPPKEFSVFYGFQGSPLVLHTPPYRDKVLM